MAKTVESTKRERIRVEKDQAVRYRELAVGTEHTANKGGTGADLTPFLGLKDVFMCAVCIGRRMHKRTRLDSSVDLIYVNYLNEQTDIALLQSVAISETNEIEVLGNMNQVCTIAEEYANTGFEELYRTLTGKGKSLVNLIGLLIDSFTPSSANANK